MRLFLALITCASASGAPWWNSSKTISYWWAVDANEVTALLSTIAAHKSVVTSLISYCGLDIRDDGTLVTTFSPVCADLFPRLRALGVQPEVTSNSGSCSIAAMRKLWSDPASPPALLAYALAANASGISIDFEPQADSCKGPPTGDAADAAPFAAWLGACRALLAPRGIRLTVAVASWSPVLAQSATLARGADRLLSMETYNGGSAAEWDGLLHSFLAGAPAAAAGVGLGAWSDGAGAWWETAGAAAHKVAAARAAGVPELAVFRMHPSKQPPWPLDFWWAALEAFVAQ